MVQGQDDDVHRPRSREAVAERVVRRYRSGSGSDPKPPSGLSGRVERAAWRQVWRAAPWLDADADRLPVERYCRMLAAYQRRLDAWALGDWREDRGLADLAGRLAAIETELLLRRRRGTEPGSTSTETAATEWHGTLVVDADGHPVSWSIVTDGGRVVAAGEPS